MVMVLVGTLGALVLLLNQLLHLLLGQLLEHYHGRGALDHVLLRHPLVLFPVSFPFRNVPL